MEGAERFKTLIPADAIQSRIRELGRQITADFQGRDLVLVGVLKGAIHFLSDLSRAVDLPLVMDFLGVSSYEDETHTTGVVRITADLSLPISGRDVLLVEDIVDTGLTLSYLLDNLRTRRPRSLGVCTLLDKPAHRVKEVRVDYTGFVIEDRFVVGYGLDDRQRYRNLQYIGYLPLEQARGEDPETHPVQAVG